MGNGISLKSKLMSTVALLLATTPAFSEIKITRTADRVPDEMIVKLKSGISTESLTSKVVLNLKKVMGETSVLSVNPLLTDKSLIKVRLTDSSNMKNAMTYLKADSDFEIVEPNYIYNALGERTPNDPEMAKLWGLKNIGQADSAGQIGIAGADINVFPVWGAGITGSRDVLVAVIDTGVQWDHPDLKDNVYTNAKEIPGNGIDDDGNGFIDDVHGWNFADNTNNSNDDHSHGSHCSGTIGGTGNNGIGVAGVNWNVSILPVKFLSATGGGTLEGAVNSINYATSMNVRVMSNSWGGGGFSDTLKQAIEKAAAKGITFVAAAGNDGADNDGTSTYPASYGVPNIIAVAATDNRDGLASFSNYGLKTVDVAAPGVKIYSTVKGSAYDTFSGTSMATPHISGVAALLLSVQPDLTPAQIRERLVRTSDKVSGLRRKVRAGGRVNVWNAINNITPPSNEPDPSLWRSESSRYESKHPYDNGATQSFVVSKSGAKFMRVHFDRIELEERYDKVTLKNSSGKVIEVISGMINDYTSDYVEGDSISVEFTSDASVNKWGFSIDRTDFIP